MLMTFLNPFGAKAEALDPVTAVSMVKKGKAVLIDVRDPGELVQSGRAVGALNIPLGQIGQKADPKNAACPSELKTNVPIILYCATGSRSGMAGKVLRKLGYETVYNIGSLSAWQGAGGKVVR